MHASVCAREQPSTQPRAASHPSDPPCPSHGRGPPESRGRSSVCTRVALHARALGQFVDAASAACASQFPPPVAEAAGFLGVGKTKYYECARTRMACNGYFIHAVIAAKQGGDASKKAVRACWLRRMPFVPMPLKVVAGARTPLGAWLRAGGRRDWRSHACMRIWQPRA